MKKRVKTKRKTDEKTKRVKSKRDKKIKRQADGQDKKGIIKKGGEVP